MTEPLLSIRDLHLEFRTARGVVRALNGVSLDVQPGEVFGLVGETGCGKTVTRLSVLRLLPPSARVTQGCILFDGRDVLQMSEREIESLRGRRISVIFQDPASSLNPVFTVGAQIEKVVRTHLRLCLDLRLISPGQYEHAARHLVEMGKLLGGWQKADGLSRMTYRENAGG